MKKFFVVLMLAVMAVFWGAMPFVSGCKSPERTAHTTLAALGQSVDMAEREYFDGILGGTIHTNRLPEIQLGYKEFQRAYGIAVERAAGNTNATSPQNLALQAAQLLRDIQAIKGVK